MKNDELFAKAAREFLKTQEGDYYYDQYESGLDHNEEGVDLSQMARFFFDKGLEAKNSEEPEESGIPPMESDLYWNRRRS